MDNELGLLVLVFLIISSIIIPLNVKSQEFMAFKNMILISLIVSISLMYGLRAEDYGADTPIYIFFFNSAANFDSIFEYVNYVPMEIGFSVFSYLIHLILPYNSMFLLICSSLIVLFFYILSRRVNEKDYIFVFIFILICFPFFKSIGINVIRSGLALSICYLSVEYIRVNKLGKGFTLGIIATSFHLVSMVFIVSFLVKEKIKVKNYIYIWLFSIAIGFVDITKVIGSVTRDFGRVGEKVSSYSQFDLIDYQVGLRLDFFILSIIPILIYFFCKIAMKKFDSLLEYYLKLYLIFNSIYFILCNLPYSDRVGMISWLLIPFFLVRLFHVLNLFYKYIFLFFNVFVFYFFNMVV